MNEMRENIQKSIKEITNRKEENIQQRLEYEETIKYLKEYFVPKFLEWTNEVIICPWEDAFSNNSIKITK